MVSTRSTQGHSTRLVHHLNPAAATKEFHPPRPFSADKKALDEFKAESYLKDVKILTTGRSWGLLTGPGVGTFLMATAWGFQLFALLTLTALPFWVMIIGTSGFFGEYSYELGNSEVGIPYMQPYSFNNKNSAVSVLPALNFGSILEDKGSFDMTSKMKYEGTSFIMGSELGRDYFLWIIGACDVLAVGILLLSRFYFLRAVRTYEHEYDEKVLELADYTVLVTGIPERMGAANAEGSLLQLRGHATKQTRAQQCRECGSQWQPLDRYFSDMFEGYAEESGHLAVQEVYPITTEGRLVNVIKERRKHERAVDRLMAQQATTGQNLSRRINAAHEKYQACAVEVVSELQNSRNHAMRAAFVVFNEPFLADLAVEEAPRGWLQRWLTPAERRLDGKHVLTVEPATAPTNYIYQNLATGWLSRLMRRSFSNAVVALVLILSFALVVLLKSYQKDLVMDLLLNDELVMDEISESAPQFFPATMVTANLSSVEGDCITHVLPRCTTSALNPFQTGVNVTMEYGQYLDVSPDALTSFYTNSFLGEMASCTLTGDCEPEAPEALQVACTICYCQGISEATSPDQDNSTIPFDYFKATTAKTQCSAFSAFSPFEAGVNAVIALLVTLVNTLLGKLIRALTKFERHRSHTEEHAALLHKTAIAQFLNTSISPLIASAEIRWLSVVVGGIVFQSGYPDFTTNWYATAGSQVTTILLATSIAPRVLGWAFGCCLPAFFRCSSRTYTQEHLHEMHMNPELHLGDAFAEVALIAMQALTFGAGVPILYPIAALAMLLNTLDTRYKLAYMWPIPRRFGVTCTYTYLRLIKIMIYVHVCFGAWMHSYFRMFGQIAETNFAEEAALAPRDEGSSDNFLAWFNYQRLFQFNTWGHVALLLAFALFEVVPAILSTLFAIMRAISGVASRPTSSPDDCDAKTFQQAVQDGDIAGANASYNVAHVMKAELFGDDDLHSVHAKVSAASGLPSASGGKNSAAGGVSSASGGDDESSKLIGATVAADAAPPRGTAQSVEKAAQKKKKKSKSKKRKSKSKSSSSESSEEEEEEEKERDTSGSELGKKDEAWKRSAPSHLGGFSAASVPGIKPESDSEEEEKEEDISSSELGERDEAWKRRAPSHLGGFPASAPGIKPESESEKEPESEDEPDIL